MPVKGDLKEASLIHFAAAEHLLLDACAFHDVTEFPHDVPRSGFRFQVQCRVVMLDRLGSFGMNF
jgi:hypothetical protein